MYDSALQLTREDLVIALRRTTVAQRIAYRRAHFGDSRLMAFSSPTPSGCRRSDAEFYRAVNRTRYSDALCNAAGRCDIDAPRTPYAASKERQERRYSLVSYEQRKYMAVEANGEGLPIATAQARRVWA